MGHDRARPAAGHSDSARGFLSSGVLATIGAAAVAVALGVGCVPWWFSHPQRMSRLIAKALPDLAADVGLDRVRLGWTGPLILDGVRLVPPGGGPTPVTIGRIEASHGLAAILLSGGDVGRVRIEGLRADVVFDGEHRSNLEALVRRKQPSDGTAAPRAARSTPLRMRLEVDDAVVSMIGPWTAEPWVSDPIDLRATLAAHPEGWSEWTIEPVQLLADARMEPAVAQGVLAYIAPVLANATRTGGRFSLRLDGARLPVGEPAAGEFSGLLSMHEVVVGPGPLVERLFESLPFQLPTPPAIRIADESHVTFRLAERRVWHEGLEFGLPLAKPGQRLDVESRGSVGIDDQSLDIKLSLPIPADLPQDRPLVAALAGKRVSVGVCGSLDEPQVMFDGSIKAAAGAVVSDLIDRLRDGRRPPTAPSSVSMPPVPPQPGLRPGELAADQRNSSSPENQTGDAIAEIVGGVLDEVARRRAERRSAEAANPDQAQPPVPPLRQRIRQRLQRPISPPPQP